MKYRTVLRPRGVGEGPIKLAKWLNAYTEENHAELIAVDGCYYIFREVMFYTK